MLCLSCSKNNVHIIIHTDKCFKCITGNDKPNDTQMKLTNYYNNLGGSQKMLISCNHCQKKSVANHYPVYKKKYPNSDQENLTPLYGKLLCCNCILKIANNENLFVD